MGLSVYVTDVVLPKTAVVCELLFCFTIADEDIDESVCDDCRDDEIMQIIGARIKDTVDGCQDGADRFEWCYADDRENWFCAQKVN